MMRIGADERLEKAAWTIRRRGVIGDTLNHLAVLSFAKHNFISIVEADRICVIADLTEEVFPLLRENLEGRVYRNI